MNNNEALRTALQNARLDFLMFGTDEARQSYADAIQAMNKALGF